MINKGNTNAVIITAEGESVSTFAKKWEGEMSVRRRVNVRDKWYRVYRMSV